MDEKVKDQDVLLVSSKDDKKLKVVAGMDEGGKLKTVPSSKEHEQDFMKFNKHSNILENFFANFLRQYNFKRVHPFHRKDAPFWERGCILFIYRL